MMKRNAGVTNPLHNGSKRLSEQERAQRNLNKLKKTREGKVFKLVQTDTHTWVEKEVT